MGITPKEALDRLHHSDVSEAKRWGMSDETSDLCRDIVAERIAELEAEVGRRRWRPMDTAPKDGTRILLGKKGFVDAAEWQAEARGWVQNNHPDSGWPDQIFYDPEGWMPLPEPPSALPLAEREGGG